MVLCFLLLWHRQVLCTQTGVVSTWHFSKQLFFFPCADVPFMQKLTLVKSREGRGVEGMEQGMRTVMFEEGTAIKKGLVWNPWHEKEGIVDFLQGTWGKDW